MSDNRGPQRFGMLDMATATDEQRAVVDKLLNGPRKTAGGPFQALLRSPALADRFQELGAQIRFGNTLPAPLRELAIIVTARHWTAQYEFYRHRQIGEEAGLDPAICDAVARDMRPPVMTSEQEAVYDVARSLLERGNVDDAQFERIRTLFGEAGVIDLIGTVGYYCMASLILNVDRVPIPADAVPLEPLARA